MRHGSRHKQAGLLWRVAIETTPEAEEPLTEVLSSAFSQPVSSYTDLRSSTTKVEAYLPSWPAALKQATQKIREALTQLRVQGVKVGTGRVIVGRLPRKNWAESWKRHFQPLEIAGKLVLKPSWSARKAGKRQVLVVLDPGLSFGTGHHPTTAFCLEQLVRFRSDQPQSFLDVGTGSGVLAIAASRLGYYPVIGFDVDGEAIRSARANARRNRVERQIQFHQEELAGARLRLARGYSVVCANLTADLLLGHRDRLLTWLEPGGLVVLAGILTEEFKRVLRHYERAGLRLVAGRTKGEWSSASFRSGR